MTSAYAIGLAAFVALAIGSVTLFKGVDRWIRDVCRAAMIFCIGVEWGILLGSLLP